MSFTKDLYQRIKNNLQKVIVGKDDVFLLAAICLFNRSHMLIEDVPGTGKTLTVKALAASICCNMKRIQFTPDLLPSDITGINFFNVKKSEFEFLKGPVFTNILLADEINRATPKTQSGLLEAMEEFHVTVDGVTHPMADIFMVVATENPIENMGVYPLPEAQLDRFLVKCSMSYPTREESIRILERFGSADPLSELEAVATKDEIQMASREVSLVNVHRDILEYITLITEATRNYPGVLTGVSPRGALALMRAAKAAAAISGRSYVLPDDVKALSIPVLAHRLVLSGSLKIKKNAAADIIREIISQIPVPTEPDIDFRA